jgi:hypothetical protein
VLLALVIFVAGIVVGAGTTVAVVVHRMRTALHHPEQAPQRIADRLRHKLDLSPHQVREVESILIERQAALIQLRRTVQPQVLAEFDKAYQQIDAVLTDAQHEHWHKMYQELKDDWLPPVPPAPPATQPDGGGP